MPNPQSKPALTKAPRKSHPLAPEPPSEPAPSAPARSSKAAPPPGRRARQDPDRDGRVVFSTRVDAELRDQVRHAAIDAGVRVGEWVEAAFTEKLAREGE